MMNVSLYAWQFLHNRFLTKDNLFRRDIIYHDLCLCANSGGLEETLSHLFFF